MRATLAVGLGAAMLLGQPVSAAVVLDQLPTDLTTYWASQLFEGSFSAYDIAVIDDFTVAGPTQITSVSAGVGGYSGFSDYSAILYYSVNIYSSVAAAAASLTGDVFSGNLAGSVTNPYSAGSASPSALVSFSLSATLAAGTYWLGVSPRNNFLTGGQTAIDAYGVGNAKQVNPNGGFGFGGNTSELNQIASYRIEGDAIVAGVPEPASWALLIAGFGLTGAALRRRRAGVAAAA